MPKGKWDIDHHIFVFFSKRARYLLKIGKRVALSVMLVLILVTSAISLYVSKQHWKLGWDEFNFLFQLCLSCFIILRLFGLLFWFCSKFDNDLDDLEIVFAQSTKVYLAASVAAEIILLVTNMFWLSKVICSILILESLVFFYCRRVLDIDRCMAQIGY